MQVLQLSHINVFKRKAIFVARMSPQKLAEKRQGEEISHFCPKPWTNVLNRCFYSLERLRLVL